jgi:hypothetical protein
MNPSRPCSESALTIRGFCFLRALALSANPCDNITEIIQFAFIVGIDNDTQRTGGPTKKNDKN